jgi:hypothetical protein
VSGGELEIALFDNTWLHEAYVLAREGEAA